ncbi:MAG: BNR repeat-containing protein, partial [Puniceicoccales bacterium]|nr:BNR repeat-containing protein [Puniceicoccales bacterium]
TTKASSKPRPGDNGSIKLADEGAWTWFNDPRALFHNGTLYAGFVRMSDGASCVNACNVETGAYATVVTSVIKQKDDHNNPALLPLADGRMMAFYALHSQLKYSEYRISTSTSPTTAADWGAARNSQTFVTGISYQNPYQLSAENGRIYNFFRDIDWDPCFIISDDLGETWSASQYLIKADGTSIRPYVKYASNYQDRVDILYTDDHPRGQGTSLYHLYIKGGKIYKTDGTSLKTAEDSCVERTLANLPIVHSVGRVVKEPGSVVYGYNTVGSTDYDDHIPSGRAWCWDIVYDKAGNPVCVFSVRTGSGDSLSNRIFYYYARYDDVGKQWKKQFIAKAGRPLYSSEGDYAGGIALDPANPDVVYISTNSAAPFDLTDVTANPLSTNERYEIWRGVRNAEGNFDWTPVTENSAKDNLRPYVPRNSPYGQSLIYFSGTYASYASVSAEVRGIFKNKNPSFAGWTSDNGLSGDDALPNADPSGIGISNLTAYAFGIELTGALTDADREKIPRMEKLANGTPVFRFQKNKALADIDYVVQISSDLQNWDDGSYTINSSEGEIEICDVAANSSEPRRFYRVKVVQK